MGTLIQLPKPAKHPIIDWEYLETVRKERYPKIPNKALTILQKIMAEKQNSGVKSHEKVHLMFYDIDKQGLPDPIGIAPRRADIIWVMDLLDRYGGELACGELKCKIRRSKKRPMLFLTHCLSEGAKEALDNAIGSFYEHFIESVKWRILGKEFEGMDLVALLVETRGENGKTYLTLFDRTTAFIFFDRLSEGMPVSALVATAASCAK